MVAEACFLPGRAKDLSAPARTYSSMWCPSCFHTKTLRMFVTVFILSFLLCASGNSLYAIEHLMTMDRRRTYRCCQTGIWMQLFLGKIQNQHVICRKNCSFCTNDYITFKDSCQFLLFKYHALLAPEGLCV